MTSRWLTLEEAMRHLRVARDKLRAAIRIGADPAWINVGTEAGPRYRFDAELIDEWWRKTCRAFVPGMEGSKSDGQTRTGRAAPARFPRNELRTSSRRRSTKPRDSAADGNLVTLARSGESKSA